MIFTLKTNSLHHVEGASFQQLCRMNILPQIIEERAGYKMCEALI